MKTAEWFDEIGMTYAMNFAAVEAARKHFVTRRESILDGLGATLERALNSAGMQANGPLEGKDGWRWRWISGKYARARTESGVKSGGGTGVAWAIEHHPDPAALGNADGAAIGFFTYALFEAPDRLYRQMSGVVADIGRKERLCSAFPDGWHEIIFIGGWMGVDEATFSLQSLEQEVARLRVTHAERFGRPCRRSDRSDPRPRTARCLLPHGTEPSRTAYVRSVLRETWPRSHFMVK